jgi:predicted 3-demethylubiquinone-9 3-methyltransferase (glyoxalase superfamily)
VIIYRDTQEEIDEVWESLIADGGAEGQCGWLKDRFGFSWQVTPSGMGKMLGGPDREGAERAMKAMLDMKKIDIAELERAYEGVTSKA